MEGAEEFCGPFSCGLTLAPYLLAIFIISAVLQCMYIMCELYHIMRIAH